MERGVLSFLGLLFTSIYLSLSLARFPQHHNTLHFRHQIHLNHQNPDLNHDDHHTHPLQHRCLPSCSLRPFAAAGRRRGFSFSSPTIDTFFSTLIVIIISIVVVASLSSSSYSSSSSSSLSKSFVRCDAPPLSSLYLCWSSSLDFLPG